MSQLPIWLALLLRQAEAGSPCESGPLERCSLLGSDNTGLLGPSRRLFCEAVAEETPGLALADEKPKEGVKTENNDHIDLKVAGQDGSVVQAKIKRQTSLSKLMKAYCERQGVSITQIRFRFDGQQINETDTLAQLEIEDEDTIDVFQQQTGGTY
uniref:Small ubiquitin-related modifier 2-A-like n=1 Tax=Phascolarctos cinereus TaxID=38626 RepID=A0A6P5LMQ7_PHACI|nr:small ubiquitin-related modifier 2-A-like [Phascolarctos cinereus]